VIVADLRLAGGEDGIAALEQLRAELGDVPGVIVTGDTGADRLAQIRRSGYPVLHKPVQADALLSVIRELTKQA
jgi:CheY-like chemotaxis protein